MRDYEEKSYYEIQLDNKQLILVFLAAVTVCVLIFVLGVMIGKGQKEAEFAAATKDEKKLADAEPDSNAPQQALTDITPEVRSEEKSVPKKPVAEKAAPIKENPKELKKPAVVEEKPAERYAYEDLDKTDPAPAAEKQKEASPAPVTTTTAVKEEEEEEGPKAAGNSRYTVQVMATSSKPKAEAQISRLKSKGYMPFMDESKTGAISVFKVRVGRFADAQEAKEMASKIQTDMKLDSWVAPLD